MTAQRAAYRIVKRRSRLHGGYRYDAQRRVWFFWLPLETYPRIGDSSLEAAEERIYEDIRFRRGDFKREPTVVGHYSGKLKDDP